VKVIGKDILFRGIRKHADAAGRLRAWLKEAEDSKWRNPQELKARYKSSSFLGDDIVIFDIGGNRYRLAICIDYKLGIVTIQWFGTHAEYSKRNYGGT